MELEKDLQIIDTKLDEGENVIDQAEVDIEEENKEHGNSVEGD